MACPVVGVVQQLAHQFVGLVMGVQLPSPTLMNTEVPFNTNLVINDTTIPDQEVRGCFSELNSLGLVTIAILSCWDMSTQISSEIISKINQNTAILLPGNSSRTMLKYFNKDTKDRVLSTPTFNCRTQRTFSGNVCTNLEVSLPKKLIDQTQNRQFTSILIIDDVCASGKTIQTLKRGLLYELNPPIPTIGWNAIFWLLSASADINGFNCNAAINYKGKNGRVAINSLSTFLAKDIKGETVTNNYIQKYFPNLKNKFLDILNKLNSYE